MKIKQFLALMIISLNSFPQEITPNDLEFIKQTNPELAKKIQANTPSDMVDVQLPAESEIENKILISEVNEEKFGYSYFFTESDNISSFSDLPVPLDYKISLRDTISVTLTGSQNDSLSLQVQLDGNILFPQIGKIYLLGKSFNQAQELIAREVSKKFVGVEVDVSLTNISAKKINIVGAVNKPGVYLVNPFSTISSVISYAAGISEFGSLRNITVRNDAGSSKFDLYDLLIAGERSNDLIIQGGDTIVANPTSNFVEIKGSVNRPMIYEFSKEDTYQDLVNFALGFSSEASTDSLYIKFRDSQKYKTKKVKISENVTKGLEEFYVGNQTLSDSVDVFVGGGAVSSGYYSLDDTNSISSILEQLTFSNDIYPFYAIVVDKAESGEQITKFAFSLADDSTYESRTISSNSEIIFFSKTCVTEKIVNEKCRFNEVNNQVLISLNIDGEIFNLPIAGTTSIERIHQNLGVDLSTVLDLGSATAITKNQGIITNSYNTELNFKNIHSISIPSAEPKTIKVEILGQISNPGLYSVSEGTSLNEIYLLGGSLSDNAFLDGIYILRESVRNKEREVAKDAQRLISDYLLEASITEPDKNIDFEGLQALVNQVDLIEFKGRVSGNFSPGSEVTKSFTLQDNDQIYVPKISYVYSIQGEVLNPGNFIFDQDLTYKELLNKSGGLLKSASKSEVFVIKADGTSFLLGRNLNNRDISPSPGDVIVVPKDLGRSNLLPIITASTRIISDLAFSAASINVLNN